jgi:hypothetical protein
LTRGDGCLLKRNQAWKYFLTKKNMYSLYRFTHSRMHRKIKGRYTLFCNWSPRKPRIFARSPTTCSDILMLTPKIFSPPFHHNRRKYKQITWSVTQTVFEMVELGRYIYTYGFWSCSKADSPLKKPHESN